MATETIVLLSSRELEKMRQVGRMAVELLSYLEPMVKAGVSTLELNDAAEAWTQSQGAKSAVLGYNGYPKSICTSVNEAVCNSVPKATQILKNGDIINITVMLQLDGLHGKTSRTFFVSEPSPTARKLVEVTEECLRRGIAQVKPGARIGDIGAAIQEKDRKLSAQFEHMVAVTTDGVEILTPSKHPKFTDAVLGGQNSSSQQPRPGDAVLGEQSGA